MILREATKGDLPAIVELGNATWTAIGLTGGVTAASIEKRLPHLRLVVLYDDKNLVAVLGAEPTNLDGQPAYRVSLVAVDQTREDKLDLLDAVALYALNIALSEGRSAVVSQRDKRGTSAAYGVDLLGMDVSGDTSTHYLQRGDARSIAALIIKRHPDWALSS